MKKRRSVLLMLLLLHLVVPSPGSAMVVNDPAANKTLLAVYAKMTAILSKLKATYDVAKGHLDSAVEVERVLSDAHSTYQTIANLDMNEIAEEFQRGDLLEDAGPFGMLGAVQEGVEGTVSTGEGNVDYAVSLKNRVKNLKRLGRLRKASVKNMNKASKNIRERDSGQITAQSTATLAMLAAIEQREKEKKRLEEAAAEKKEEKNISSMGNIYKTMGKNTL
ncbi:MAG: hypothetical protein ACE5F7_04980 [Nitrospiria bacterium]